MPLPPIEMQMKLCHPEKKYPNINGATVRVVK